MSSWQPDERPDSHDERDELDDFLDNLLTGARRDLRTSVERVLDLDRGLDAILSHEAAAAGRSDAPTKVSNPQEIELPAASVGVLSPHPPNRPMSPLPQDCVDHRGFAAALEKLRVHAGLSLRTLADACTEAGHAVMHATIGGWFKDRLVSRGNEPAFRVVLGMLGVTEQVDQDAWLAAARKLRTRRPQSTGGEPFRGLESYNDTDAKFFYGRKALIDRVLDEVDALHIGGGGVGLLTGASGAGKSSLLKAGVIPALREGRLTGSASWPVLFMSGGPDPVDGLAEEVAACLCVDTNKIARELRGGPAAVAGALQRVVGMSTRTTSPADAAASDTATDARLVVIVDQFELAMISAENGTTNDDALESFLAVLRAMMSGPVPVAAILSVRLDFLNAAMQRRSLRDLTNNRPPVFVGPMDDDDLTQVIEEPVRRLGGQTEPGFTALVLREVSARGGWAAHQAGTLPLLSHALRMTWQRGGGKQMTVANYRAVGGVDGAVRDSAEKIYADLSSKQQVIARRMFLSLVDVHPAGADTRRKIPLDDLFAEIEGAGAELDIVLDRFVAQRLLTIDEDTVEITHEALIVAWPELRAWLDTNRDGRIVAQQLNADARAWDQADRPASDLYQGTRLQAAKDWRDSNPSETTELSRAFLAAAIRQSRRATTHLRVIAVVLAVLLLVASTLTVIVMEQSQTLDRQRDEAQSRALASQVSTLRGKDVALARQLALAAYRIAPTTEARSALIDATALRPAMRMLGGPGNIHAVGIHPRGTIAAAAAENTVRFWDITDPGHPKPRPDLPAATCSKIYTLAFSPNGNLLAASCSDGTIHLWDTHDPVAPTALPTLSGLGAEVYAVAFSPDGSMMAAAIAEPPANDHIAGTVRLWTITGVTPQPLGDPLRVDDNAPAKSVAFHPSNKHLAVGTDDGTVQLWDISTPGHVTHPVRAVGATKAIGQLAFSPDGTMLAAGGADSLVHLWSTADPGNPSPDGPPIDGAASLINAVAFSPDGAILAIASSDANNGVRLVDLASRDIIATMPHPSVATSVKFSPDGTSVITGANDGTARIWPVASPALAGLDHTINATRFSPNGATLALGSADLRLLDVTNPQHPTPLGPALANPDKFSGTLAFAPNNRLLAEGRGKSGTVQLWNVTNPSRPTPLGPALQTHTQQVDTVAFSPDSTILATGSRDGAVHLWDVRTPEAPVALSTPGEFGGSVNEVSFSPNGKLLAAGSTDQTVRLWDVTDPRSPTPIAAPLKPADYYVYSTVFSPDGTMLAVSLANSTIWLYDITEPAHPTPIGAPLTGPQNYVYSLSFATDGTTLAASTSDGAVWIWDLHRRDAPTLYATLTLATGAMYPVNYQPHTHLLVAGGAEKKAWIWTTDTDTAATLICNTSGNTITPEEWAHYVPGIEYRPPCPTT